MGKWALFLGGLVLIAGGALLAARTQTDGGIRVEDVRFAGANDTLMSGLLYVPPNATRTPAPGVLAVHGLINTREMQDGFAIEFARRGYVVLALDQTGHGYSAPPAFANGWGGPDGLKYLRSLPFVDKNNIGLEGHSLGGAAILSAAKAYPAGYRALILVGSTTGAPINGSATFPRNAAFVLGAYDEFTPSMWSTQAFYDPGPASLKLLAKDVGTSAKLKQMFAATEPVKAGQLYGSIADGTARELYLPQVTHPGEHISRAAIGDATDWFSKTLKGGTPRPNDDQIWYWKELGTLITFAGFVSLLLGTFDLLLSVPPFAHLARPAEPARETRDLKWWTALLLGRLIPGLLFLPLMIAGGLILPASATFPQTFTNQIMVWALGTLAVLALASLLYHAGKVRFTTGWFASIALGILTVAVGYASLFVVDRMFHVDYRFWVVALKLMSPWQFKAFLLYLLPFSLFFFLTLRGLQHDIAVRGESAFAHYVFTIIALAGGILALLLAEYAPMRTSGHLLFAFDPLHPIMALQFVPVLAIVAAISTFTYRRTNSYVPGAVIASLFVTWYIVAGTATML